MTDPKPVQARRTHFNKPLIEESLQHLPAALEHTSATQFSQYLQQHLHHNSQTSRQRFAAYIVERFSENGAMNLGLARAIKKFGRSRISREILFFELIRATPVLREIASLWLAEVPPEGLSRDALYTFLKPRMPGRRVDQVGKSAVAALRQCGKLTSPKLAIYAPIWAEPPIEAFCYVLAVLYPEPTMVKVDLFTGSSILRAMLWPQPAIEGLLKQAEQLGHISKISQLDQYHQFTLAGTGEERLKLLLGEQQGETADVLPLFRTDPPATGSSATKPESLKSSEAGPKKRAASGKSSRSRGHGPGSGDNRTFLAPEG